MRKPNAAAYSTSEPRSSKGHQLSNDPIADFKAIKSYVSLIGLALVIISPYLFILLTNLYVPFADDTFQLQAAYRLAHHQGYTYSSTWNAPLDLSVPRYEYLTIWPPGYSLMIAGFLQLGSSIEFAAGVFKSLTILFGIGTWLVFSAAFIKPAAPRILFLLFVSVSAVYYSYSPTSLFCWAFMPIYSTLMLFMMPQTNAKIVQDGTQWRLVVGSSLLVALLLLVRYQNVFLLAIGVVWLMLLNRGDLRRMVQSVTVFSALPLITAGALAYQNLRSSGSLSYHNKWAIVWDWNIEWIGQALEALVLSPIYLDKAIRFLFDKLDMHSYAAPASQVLALLVTLMMGYLLYRSWKSAAMMTAHILWFAVSFACLVSFLAILTILYSYDSGFVFLADSRFYWPIVPLLALCVLNAIFVKAKRSNDLRSAGVAVQILVVLAFVLSESGIIGYALYTNGKFERYNAKKSLVVQTLTELTKRDHQTPMVVVGNGAPFIWGGSMIPAYRFIGHLGEVIKAKTYFSKPTWLVIVVDEVHDRLMESGESRALSKALLDSMEKQERGPLTIYRRQFGKGSLLDQI